MKILAVDGHDASGKTTLTIKLANKYDCPIVRPFSNDLGDHISWLWKHERYDDALSLAKQSIERCFATHKDNEYIIFDRHWLCLTTVIHEEKFQHWKPFPPTILFWSDPQTTFKRISSRNEIDNDLQKHIYYCNKYKKIAKKHDLPILDTSELTLEEGFIKLLEIPLIKEIFNN